MSYHQAFSSDWVKRLGDGTAESKEKMQEAINDLWTYTDELFHQTEADKANGFRRNRSGCYNLKKAYY